MKQKGVSEREGRGRRGGGKKNEPTVRVEVLINK
jgi:hypothetical protein